MTDEQIIKALECCSTDVGENTCPKCAFYKKQRCSTLMLNAVSNLIDRQKAEIERLTDLSDQLGNDVDIKLNYIYDLEEKIKTAKSEAIKEFAKRLKSRVNDLEFRTKTHRKTVPTKFCDDNANWVMHECVPEEIDNLVKEVTEESE